jgi:hypothetical protein
MSNIYSLRILAALAVIPKQAKVSLAYRQTMNKPLTYDLSSEASINMQ